MTQYPAQPTAHSIRPYSDARDEEQKDALNTLAPHALTDLLASAMTAMAGLEASTLMAVHRPVSETEKQ
jgi:hypothetical protein